MERGEYDLHKRLQQIELLKLRGWIKQTGRRLVVMFEDRDAAGKGGTIKRFTGHLNPRGARVVAVENAAVKFSYGIGHAPWDMGRHCAGARGALRPRAS